MERDGAVAGRGASSRQDPRLALNGSALFLIAAASPASALALVSVLWRREAFAELLGAWQWPLSVLFGLGAAASVAAFFTGLARWRDGRWCETSVLVLRVFAYCTVAAWILILLLVNTYNPAAPRLALGLLGAVFGCFALARVSGFATGRWRWWRALDLLAFNLCVLVLGGELVLRTLAMIRPSVLLMRPSADVVQNVEGARYAPGTVRHGFPVNSTGHYDEEFTPRADGERLVVAIGDSFSASVVHHSMHFTTVAEGLLPGVAIYNMGLPSIGPREYAYLVAHEALPLDPQVLVINIFVGNDLSFPLPPRQSDTLLRGVFDRENLLLVQVPQRLATIAKLDGGAAAALDGRSASPGKEEIAHTADEARELFPWMGDPLAERERMSRDTFLKLETFGAARLAELSAEEIGERLQPLRTIVRMARDTKVLAMIIPDRFQVEDYLWQKVQPPDATEKLRMRSVWITQEMLKREGVPYLSLVRVLRAVPPMEDGSRHLYHLNDTHFNARGNRVAGEALAAFLEEHLEPAG